jgi:acetyl esterase/lipase
MLKMIISNKLAVVAFILGLTGCAKTFADAKTVPYNANSYINIQTETENGVVNKDTFVAEVINSSLLEGFGKFIFPVSYSSYEGLTLDNINFLLPYHSHIDTDTTINVINTIMEKSENGETVFYDIYTDEEKELDKSKENTGLPFFKGEENAPFAVINAGGGFAYVGSIHESLPHALELSKRGYNAFALQYRTGGADVACEDLAAAISFIFKNADEFGVSTEGYSLWGGSAGARMAAYIGSYGTAAFGGEDLPIPSAVIMQYTGHSDYTKSDPPTYACVGENDGIANWRIMEKRINTLKSIGIDTEFHHYPNLGHGFGLGIGTTAEGWIDDAVDFWEKHIK